MPLISILFTTVKLLVACFLTFTVMAGYGALASTAILHAHYGGLISIKIAILLFLLSTGIYFSVQVGSTLLAPKTEPLSSQGYELYPQQRASTLWLCGVVGWYCLLSTSITAPHQLLILSLLLGYAQLQLAQTLSGGKVCDLLPDTRNEPFSLSQFMNDKIICYADKKYLNAQITCSLLFLLLPLALLSEATIAQGPMAIGQYVLWSFAQQAQWLVGTGVILPCACYIWSAHPFFVRLRAHCHWLAPSLLCLFQGLSLITALQQSVISHSEVVVFNATALFFSVLAAPITKQLMPHSRVTIQPTAQSNEVFRDLKEEAHLLF